jgi:pimeloyl-ACP methyl ester carboxylesterase
MYYEVHGTGGTPLVLLHGAISNITTDFGKLLPAMAQGRRVVGVEQQAHGLTADIDRPLTYDQMAEDTVALLQQLNISQADFFGYSVGTGVAVPIAVRHPEMVRKLVLAAAACSREGFLPGLFDGMDGMRAEDMIGTPWQQTYTQMAPRPEDWPRLVGRIKDLSRAFVGWPEEAIASIKAPTLLINGDSDIVPPEHAVKMFRLLGRGVPADPSGVARSRLAVLPGTRHVTLVERGAWLASMITKFLDAPMPESR